MKKIRLTLAIFCLACLFAGCVDRRDIDENDYVVGAIFDYNTQKQRYEVHIQVALPEAFTKAPGGGGQPKETFLLYEGEGESVFDAIRDAAKNAGKRLFWAHCDAYIVSKELAGRGIFGVMDILIRDNEIRETAYFYINDGTTEDLLTVKNGTEEVPMLGLKKLVDLGLKTHGTTLRKEVMDCFRDLHMENSAYLVPLVSSRKPDVPAKEAHKKFHLTGAAVFKKDKMIGRLTSAETRGYVFAVGQIKDTLIVGNVLGKQVTFEVIGSRAELKPRIQGDEISFTVEVKPTINVGQVNDPVNLEDPRFIREAEQAFNRELEQEIQYSINKAKEMKADYFDFARQVQLADPKLWKQVRNQWSEQLFPEMDIQVKVQSTMLRTGLLISTEIGGPK
ncbi:MAG: Ger(x)C family spore germination protein [Bacillota bacterium]